MSNNNNNNNNTNNKAFADATAGVIASLLSLWIFYPLEIIKINVQASCCIIIEQQRESNNNNNNNNSSSSSSSSNNSNKNDIITKIKNNIQYYFSGIHIKSIHTACSSFCYFYLYSFIISVYTKKERTGIITPSKRLVLSAIAAMLNTFVTLPLDVISTQQQTRQQQNLEKPRIYYYESKSSCDSYDSGRRTNSISNIEEEKKDEQEVLVVPNSNDNITVSSTTIYGSAEKAVRDLFKKEKQQQQQRTRIIIINEKIEKIKLLWKGLIPSLLLCTNPAINMTVYDSVKTWYIKQRSLNNNNNNKNKQQHRTLTMIEAFIIGIISKFIATIITYPLIQAKVKMMSSNNNNNNSLLLCLYNIYQRGGIIRLYNGCNLQLIHTMLKSALLMMLRERIERITRKTIILKV